MAVSSKLAQTAASMVPLSWVPPRAIRQSRILKNLLMRAHALKREWYEQRAREINALAENIHSLDDAQKLVKMIAAELSKLPGWATRRMRDRLALAEYKAAADPSQLIPDGRVAAMWNGYLKAIGAPEPERVTAEEIHNARDARYVCSQTLWAREGRSIWSMPGIYAIGLDGKVADGCRPMEALHIFWCLFCYSDELANTRERIKKGQRFSDMVRNPTVARDQQSGRCELRFSMKSAEQFAVRFAFDRYKREFGASAANRAVEDLIIDLLGGGLQESKRMRTH